MFKIRNLIIVGGITAGIVGGAVAPAMAATNPIQVSATVGSTLTMSGQTDIAFGSVPAGVATTLPGVEHYNVSANAPYTLQIDPANASMRDLPGSDTIPNSALSVKETGENAGSFTSFNGTNPLVIATAHAAGNFNYSEDWQINPSASTPAANYSETFTFDATAS